MDSDGGLDNANPTILNDSELSAHRQRRKNKGVSTTKERGIRELLMAKPSYATIDPFYMSEVSDTDSDDSSVEPIDEQEIYGEFIEHYFVILFALSHAHAISMY
jgi:hypothetical protein